MFALPRLGTLTQGTVFCGGICDSYRNVPVWGLVITARCDTTHEKAHVVNYLPLVRIEDWLCVHGGLIILNRALRDAIGRFKNLLAQCGLSSSLLDVYEPKTIVSVHFPPSSQGSKEPSGSSKEAAKARELAEDIDKLRSLIQNPNTTAASVGDAAKKKTKIAEVVLKELFGHQVAGYYYIPDIGDLTEHASPHGYVACLREVRHIPIRAANLMRSGLARDAATQSGCAEHICFDVFDFACPVAEMKSPWIEHLMQAFCNLFSRIGVDDHDKSRAANILAALEKEKSGAHG